MEKKKIIIIALAVVAVTLAIACAVVMLGQGDTPGFIGDKLNVSDRERPAEPGAYDGESASKADPTTGTDIDSVDDSGSASGSNESASSGGSNQGYVPSWPEDNPPADDGSATQGVTYSQYQAMSATEQQAWFDSFDSVEAFFAWYNEAKAVHDANDDSIIIDGNTNIDMGEIAKKQS